MSVPRILVIDDLFGREVDGGNRERQNLCATLGVLDAEGDKESSNSPVALASFVRGQRPAKSRIGDRIQNDLQGTVETVRGGPRGDGTTPWALIVVDLCFYQGLVTQESARLRGYGMPEGLPADDRPDGYFGLQILEAISRDDLPAIVFSSMPKESRLVEAYTRVGARGFLARDDDDAREKLRGLLTRHGLIADHRAGPSILGHSRPLLHALRDARMAAASEDPVLFRGDPGTGKELFARYLHDNSLRARAPYLASQISTSGDELVGSALFGHKRGAFTGATEGRMGLLEAARSGTLFLDEIGVLSASLQEKLLRVLSAREFQRLGESTPIPLGARILSATNADIEASNGFRDDLLERLRGAGTIRLPRLRDRGKDLDLLAEAFLGEVVAERGLVRRGFDRGALDCLHHHDWPGNVRELRRVVRAAVMRYPDSEIVVEAHLGLTTAEAPGLAPAPSGNNSPGNLRGALGHHVGGLLTYVRQVLDATRGANGELNITRAFRVMEGTDRSPSQRRDTQRALDFLKRLPKIHPEAERACDEDPVLRDALAATGAWRSSTRRHD